MPVLKDKIDDLRLFAGEPILETWYADLTEVLTDIVQEGAVTYEGYIQADLIPIKDLEFKLGKPIRRLKEVHGGYGYFSYSLFVENKRVLKDEDPIHLASLYEYAISQLKSVIISAFDQLKIPPKPILLDVKADYYVTAFTDIFYPDLLVLYSGRTRTKIATEFDSIVYKKWIPSAVAVEVTKAMKDSAIKANTWYEFDFAVNKDDKVNVRVSQAGRVTVAIYNIPEA